MESNNFVMPIIKRMTNDKPVATHSGINWDNAAPKIKDRPIEAVHIKLIITADVSGILILLHPYAKAAAKASSDTESASIAAPNK